MVSPQDPSTNVHLPLFPTAPRIALPQDPSTSANLPYSQPRPAWCYPKTLVLVLTFPYSQNPSTNATFPYSLAAPRMALPQNPSTHLLVVLPKDVVDLRHRAEACEKCRGVRSQGFQAGTRTPRMMTPRTRCQNDHLSRCSNSVVNTYYGEERRHAHSSIGTFSGSSL